MKGSCILVCVKLADIYFAQVLKYFTLKMHLPKDLSQSLNPVCHVVLFYFGLCIDTIP